MIFKVTGVQVKVYQALVWDFLHSLHLVTFKYQTHKIEFDMALKKE